MKGGPGPCAPLFLRLLSVGSSLSGPLMTFPGFLNPNEHPVGNTEGVFCAPRTYVGFFLFF